MATVTGFTAARMETMEAATIVDGNVVGDNLILTRHDATTIDAGNVRGATGSPGVTSSELLDSLPIGSVWDYMGTTAPNAKWLLMTGQTVTSAQSLYPTWWALIPSSMKSGTSAIMPNTKGKVSVGYDAADADFNVIGQVGGEKKHTLIAAEIPSHTHTFAHTHTIDPPITSAVVNDPTHTHAQVAHSHSVYDPSHNHVQTPHAHEQPDHYHSPRAGFGGYFMTEDQTGGSLAFTVQAGSESVFRANTTSAQQGDNPYHATSTAMVDLAYAVTGISLYNNTAVNNASYTGISATVDISVFTSSAASTSTTSSVGADTSHNNLQPFVVFTKMVKVL